MNQLTMTSVVIPAEATPVSPAGKKTLLEVLWQPAKSFFIPLMIKKIPTRTAPEPVAVSEPLVAPNTAVYPLSILVVEDNRINRMLTMRMLSHLGYSAEAVTNGRECMEAMVGKTYDLYLMDLQMPVMNGFMAAREIRRWHHLKPGAPEPYICALTANVLTKAREECLAAGMNDFLPKPLRLEALKILVTRVAENLKDLQGQAGN